MNSEKSLWGTFSVADHRRKRPFVSDVLLYDRLVVPIPDGEDERDRWRGLHRDPDRQESLLRIMGDLAIGVPWSLKHHRQWAERYGGATAQATDLEAAVRDDIAHAVEFDVSNVATARRNAPPGGPQDAVNPDDPGYLMTRMVLADEFGSRKDRAIVAGIPRVDEVETVVAYGSYKKFASERGALENEAASGGQPVFTFGWSFFVPATSERTDDDLLREAVDLAHSDEVVAWRAAVQRWRRDSFMKGESDAAALEDMNELIGEYGKAAQKRRIRVRARWGFAVASALAGAAAVVVPPVGAAAALFGVGSLLPSGDIPKRLEAAAMFHEARRHFS
jgi:hypothetical protein